MVGEKIKNIPQALPGNSIKDLRNILGFLSNMWNRLFGTGYLLAGSFLIFAPPVTWYFTALGTVMFGIGMVTLLKNDS